MFKRLVSLLEIVALVAAAAFVVGLFISPAKSHVSASTGGSGGTGGTTNVASGADLFAQNCSSCHGGNGEGGVGPKLSGGAVLKSFPKEADQIAFVTNGAGGMPAFGKRLTAAEIAAVVHYTRTDLAQK
jgi:mono/diheme cytochrome c family protein